MNGKGTNTLTPGAATQPHGRRVPSRIADLISQESQERRARAIQARLEDVAHDRVLRQRSAKVIADSMIARLSRT